jgi:hypothetical protein
VAHGVPLSGPSNLTLRLRTAQSITLPGGPPAAPVGKQCR